MVSMDRLIEEIFKVCQETEDNIIYTNEASLHMESADRIPGAVRIIYRRRNLMFVTMVGVKDSLYCMLCMYFAINSETDEVEHGPSMQEQSEHLDVIVNFFKHNLKEAAVNTQKAIFDMQMEEVDG